VPNTREELAVNYTRVTRRALIAVTSAELSNPSGLAVDIKGSVYVTDGGSNRMLELTVQ
jgi:hypothetical protein